MVATPSIAWRPERIAVVGLGLLGASLVEAARKRWPGLKVTGVSSEPTLEKARQAKLLDQAHPYTDINLACVEADLIILCTPIDNILNLLKTWAVNPPSCKPGCVITDVGSTKAEICAQGRKTFGDAKKGAVFIGSHPMAGSEKSGLEYRDALLFENASWVICHMDEAADPAVSEAAAKVEIFAQGLGARTTRMLPELHDQVAAHVSHLPQLLATALASYIGNRSSVVENCVQIAGGGFRDMTRLAASSYTMWDAILRSNQQAIREAMSGFRLHLTELETALNKNLGADYFRDGNRLRGQLSTAKKGFALPLTEILVNLEDKPGTLVQVFRPLAERGINVLDVEILKVREGEGGTMMMGFHGNEEAKEALECLATAGFVARLR